MMIKRAILSILAASTLASSALALAAGPEVKAGKPEVQWTALNANTLALNFPNKASYLKILQRAAGDSSLSPKALVEKLRLALASLKFDEPKKALAILPSNVEFKKAGLPVDYLMITRARAQYQAGDFAGAEKSYSEVPQISDFWITAIEERAHTKGKAGDYNQALGDITTLMSPVFEKNLGPEPYFTAALTYFRLCQFGKVFETLEKYKTNMKARAQALEAVADRKSDAKILEAVEEMRKKGFSNVAYAKLAPSLPTNFHLDFGVRSVLNNPDATVDKVAKLAEADLDEISRVTRQMQLVEAEVMQRLHIAEQRRSEGRGKIGKFKSGKNQMVFPYNGEVWLDEVDQYQVQSELCPNKVSGI